MGRAWQGRDEIAIAWLPRPALITPDEAVFAGDIVELRQVHCTQQWRDAGVDPRELRSTGPFRGPPIAALTDGGASAHDVFHIDELLGGGLGIESMRTRVAPGSDSAGRGFARKRCRARQMSGTPTMLGRSQ